jgi:hypothetical protein
MPSAVVGQRVSGQLVAGVVIEIELTPPAVLIPPHISSIEFQPEGQSLIACFSSEERNFWRPPRR